MRSFTKALDWLLSALNLLGAIWVILIMLLITVDVLGRAFFNAPLVGVPEIVKVSVVGIVWCLMAHTLRIGAHLRSTILLERMSSGPRRIVEIVSCLMGITVFALIVFSGWSNTLEAWRIGEFEGEEPVRVPTYPIRMLVLIGAALTALQFLVMLIDVLRGKSLQRADGER